MSKTLNRTEMPYYRLSGFGIRHSFVIGYFVNRHSSADVNFKVALSNYGASDFGQAVGIEKNQGYSLNTPRFQHLAFGLILQ